MSDEEPLDPIAAKLLDVERRRPEPGADVEERIFAHLTKSIGALPGGGGGGGNDAGGAGTRAATATGAAASKLGGLALAFAIGIGVGAIGHAKLSRTEPPVSVMTAPAIVPTPVTEPTYAAPPDSSVVATVAPVASIAPVAPTASARPALSVRPSSSAPHAPDRDKDLALARERASIEQARMALARGSAADALAALEAHAREFPDGRLAEERDALRIHALVSSGRREEAATRARAFRATYPSSVFLPVVDRAAPKN